MFLPGTLCDERLWAFQYAALSAEWPCVNVDYRNERSVADMAGVALGSRAGMLIPIGLSMGGMVALEMWCRAPQRVAALALFDTDAGADTADRAKSRQQLLLQVENGGAHALLTAAREQLVPRYFARPALAFPQAFEIAVDMAVTQGAAAYAAQHHALATRQDYWAALPTIAVPTLIACGDDDPVCTSALHVEMSAAIPSASLHQIPAGGHLPPLAQPTLTRDVLATWLDTLPSDTIDASVEG